MKLRQNKIIASGNWAEFKFDVGKGSRIKWIIISTTGFYGTSGDFVSIYASEKAMPDEPAEGEFMDVRDGFEVRGTNFCVPRKYFDYELWDKEVQAENSESYYVGIVSTHTDSCSFQVDLIIEKPKTKNK